jgi:hypothetical protein
MDTSGKNGKKRTKREQYQTNPNLPNPSQRIQIARKCPH